MVTEAIEKGAVGPYQIQAAIAALHDEAKKYEDTDWPQILALYNLLLQMTDNPVVRLNRAVAVAMVHGPKAGLEALEALDRDRRIAGHYRLDAVRAHFYEMAGEIDAAIAHFRAAAKGSTSIPERTYLAEQAQRLSTSRRS